MNVIEIQHQHHLAHYLVGTDEILVVDTLDTREDLTVQVKLSVTGDWHRKAVGGYATACGKKLGGYATRVEQYMGSMCADGCFSRYELELVPQPPDAPFRDLP